MPALDMTRVTVAATLDDCAPYSDDVLLLFASLERFGGALRAARRRAYLIDGVSRETKRRLGELGVEVRVREAVNPRFRFANKVRMFDPADNEDCDLLVALDCDVVVAGDFSDYLDRDVVQAKQADGDRLTFELWQRLFGHFGCELPTERYPTNLEPGWTHAYFNTGVLLVPRPHLAGIHATWPHYIDAIVNDADAFADLARHMQDNVPEYDSGVAPELHSLVFAEQWGFSLALQELAMPYAVLPLAMNFPPPYTDDHEPGAYIRARFLPDAIRPLLVHHHHDHAADGLRLTGYREPDRVLAQLNAALWCETIPVRAR
jgi:hypothetical protein